MFAGKLNTTLGDKQTKDQVSQEAKTLWLINALRNCLGSELLITEDF
jgi:hypothetical protein